ncbi:hypothetical protein [Sanguibacter antarcticus]|uniref:Uncharacterized protein n=1 Tax=Sanguibacter antarcticus TaxID=372484 RepID=A0A2A9E2T1_9MICO|nr:hypothetical protein [Sanguibacter antarcticus]PFG33143.1 hypothetical protein ATL42_1003 [Sanguibacter antarcticus]
MNESSTSEALQAPGTGAGSGSSGDRARQVAHDLHDAHPEFDEVPLLEDDETVPPRPEEEVADIARQDRGV